MHSLLGLSENGGHLASSAAQNSQRAAALQRAAASDIHCKDFSEVRANGQLLAVVLELLMAIASDLGAA